MKAGIFCGAQIQGKVLIEDHKFDQNLEYNTKCMANI